MKCEEIIKKIESRYPREAALGFDNVGLLAGRRTKEVSTVFLALDATTEVIQEAICENADMLITHHPLIFSPVKQVTDEGFVERRIFQLIQEDISYYAIHTNYDVLGMAQLAEKTLELQHAEILDITFRTEEVSQGIGRVGELQIPMTLAECCRYVKQKLGLEHVKLFGNPGKVVRRLAISPGAGKSEIKPALEKKADVLVTGDIGHHEGLDALEQGLAIIDAGHYGTEHMFVKDMEKFLRQNLDGITVKSAVKRSPFEIF